MAQTVEVQLPIGVIDAELAAPTIEPLPESAAELVLAIARHGQAGEQPLGTTWQSGEILQQPKALKFGVQRNDALACRTFQSTRQRRFWRDVDHPSVASLL